MPFQGLKLCFRRISSPNGCLQCRYWHIGRWSLGLSIDNSRGIIHYLNLLIHFCIHFINLFTGCHRTWSICFCNLSFPRHSHCHAPKRWLFESFSKSYSRFNIESKTERIITNHLLEQRKEYTNDRYITTAYKYLWPLTRCERYCGILDYDGIAKLINIIFMKLLSSKFIAIVC